jgi:hypothetical protein
VENFEKKDPAGNNMTSDPIVQIQVALALEEAEPQKGISILQDALVAMSEDDPLNWPSAPMLTFLTSRLAARAGFWSVAQAAVQDALMAWQDEARWHSQAARIFLSEDPDGDLPDMPLAIQHLEASIRLNPKMNGPIKPWVRFSWKGKNMLVLASCWKRRFSSLLVMSRCGNYWPGCS